MQGTAPRHARCSARESNLPDPRFVQQWGLRATATDLAWNITTGSTDVVVAIIDSGIDYRHPDLYLNVWLNQEEIPPDVDSELIDVDHDGLITFWDLNDSLNQGPGKITDLNANGYIDGGDLLQLVAQGGWADGLDNGDNGYVDDLIGWDFYDEDNDPMDSGPEGGHGTAVAGIIGAVGDNGVGVAGINGKTQLMAVRNHPGGKITTEQEFQRRLSANLPASFYSLDNGARIINASLGAPAAILPPDFVAALSALLDKAAARQVLIVASAGNVGLDTDIVPQLPSAFPHDNVISVAATFRHQDNLAFFGEYWASNFGATTVDLGAPGDYIWTTAPLSSPGIPYDGTFGGTSAAAPHVAGAAALILSVNPNLSYAEVKALILDNVDPVEDLKGITVTRGRLNVLNSVLEAVLR